MKPSPSLLLQLALLGSLALPASAIIINKGSVGTDLNNATSWNGDIPGSGDIANWALSSRGGGLTAASDLSWQGITVASGTVTGGNISITGAGSITLGSSGITNSNTGRTLTIANGIVLGANQTWSLASNATFSGGISGSGNLIKTGSGLLSLTTTPNSYTGTTTVNGGIMQVGASGLTGTTGVTIGASGTLTLLSSNMINDASNVDVNGILSMRGAEAINGLSGTGTVENSNSLNNPLTLTVGADGGTASFGGLIRDGNIAATRTGTLALVKIGSGTQTITTTQSYTGTTSVNDGTLVVNGGLTGTSSVTVASIATLGGIGNINTSALVTVNGTLSPGNSAGTLSLGSLALASTATFDYEFGLSASDMVEVAGSLGLGGATLDLSDLATGTLDIGDSLTLFAYDGLWDTTNFSGLADDSTFTSTGYEWLIDYDSSTPGSLNGGSANSYVTLTVVTVIPEPGAALLGGMGFLLLLRRRR